MITRTTRGTKRFAVAVTAAVIGSTLAISGSALANDASPLNGTRVAGADRYATATAVADMLPSINTITVVNGLNFPDGLTGSLLNAGIILTEAGSIPAPTKTWLDANNVAINNVNVVGGTAVVSTAVFEELATYGAVTRLAGANRYETALAVAATEVNPTTIIVATGANFPDALAAGPLAIENNAPIILNDGPALRADVKAYLDANPTIVNAFIVGGEAAVPATVAAELSGPRGYTVTRLAGSNRDATAAAIANELRVNSGFLFGVTDVNRLGFADALSAGPLAWDNGYPILTVGVDSIPAATAMYHSDNCNTIGTVTAIGGTAVISDATLAAAAAAARCSAATVTSATLQSSDQKQRVITVDDGTAAVDATLTAVQAGPAGNNAGNAWTVSFANGATPGAVVDTTTNPAAPTITYTDAFSAGLTQTQFVANFNASAAGPIFAAATTNGAGTYAAAPAAASTSPASVDYTVVVTFDRNVDNGGAAAPIPFLSNNTNPAINSQVSTVVPTAIAPAPYPAAGGSMTVTYLFDDEVAAQSLASGSAKFAIGTVRATASNTFNNTVIVGPLTAA